MSRPSRLGRLVAFVGIVLTIVAGAAIAGAVLSPPAPTFGETEGYEYDVETLQTEIAPAEGEVDVDVHVDGVLLIDDAHRNRFEPEELRALTAAATEAGFEIRYMDSTADVESELDRADAFVVVDPATEYDNETADAVEEFVEDDGRLLVLAEPNRGDVVQVDLLAAEVVTVRSETTALASRFGISFGSEYLYNVAENDGNHQNVYATPTEETAFDRDVDRTVLSTATHVEARNGTPLLTTVEGTQRSGTRTEAEYAVAVRDGNVLAVSDTTFLEPDRHVVADNEKFVAEIVEFLAGG